MVKQKKNLTIRNRQVRVALAKIQQEREEKRN